MKLKFGIILIAALLILPVLCLTGCENNADSTDTTAPTGESTPSADTTAAVTDGVITVSALAEYALIRSEKVSSDVSESISALYVKLRDDCNSGITFKDDFFREGNPAYAIGELEIIAGKTNRPETTEFLSGLKRDEWGYAVYGKKIVIAGNTDEGTIKAVNRFITDIVDKCKDNADGTFISAEQKFIQTVEYPYKSITLDGTSLSEYTVVYPIAGKYSEKLFAEKLCELVADKCGVLMNMISDRTEGAAELKNTIQIGETAFVTDAMKSAAGTLDGKQSYVGYPDGMVWLYGTSITTVSSAVSRFSQEIKNGETAGSDTIVIKKSDTGIYSSEAYGYSVMSFNILTTAPGETRKNRVLSTINKYTPDLVGLQEVSPTWYTIMKDTYSAQYGIIGVDRNGSGKGEYNNILYKKDKFNLLSSGTKWMSDTPDRVSRYEESSYNRIFTYALLEEKTTKVQLLFVNTHLEHTSSAARVKQIAVLLDFLKDYPDYPIVITGDFNDVKTSEMYKSVTATRLADSAALAVTKVESETFHNYGAASKIIDFCFVSEDSIAVDSYKVVAEKVDGDYPSDHHPLFVEFVVLK